MTKFYIVSNKHEKEYLDELISAHNQESEDEFYTILCNFVAKHRNDSNRPYLFDKITDLARHVIYSFQKYKEEPLDTDLQHVLEKDYVMMLSFFFNAHALISLLKNHAKMDIDSDLSRGIKFFRDCFAHQYEKELFQKGEAYYIPHIRQRAMSMLDILEMCDPDSGKIVYEINFSLRYFYVSLQAVFKKYTEECGASAVNSRD